MQVSERTHAASVNLGTSFRSPDGLWYAAAGAVALLLGVVAGLRPVVAEAGTIALVLAPFVFANAVGGLCILLFLSFLETVSAAIGAISLTKIVGLLLLLGWLGVVATGGRSDRRAQRLFAREPVLAVALVFFIAWVAISLAWAERPASGATPLSRFALDFALFPIALAAVKERRHVLWVFAVFIAGALTSAAVGISNGSVTTSTSEAARLGGAGLNANQIGTLLVVAIVLSVTLAANARWAPVARLAALGAGIFGAIGLFMTLSRGALVGLGVALLVAPIAVGRGRRAGALVLVVAAVVGTVAWFAAVAPQSAVDRVTHPARAGGSGREELWTVGWRMVKAHPLRGVGAGNFPVSSIHYLFQPGLTTEDRQVVELHQPPHNIYLAVLSELGAVGLLLFVTIIASAVACVLRAARTFARRGDPTMEILARGLLVALAGYLAALFFSTQVYDKQLWLLLAMGPALLAIAERGGRHEDARIAPLTRRQHMRARAGHSILEKG